MTIRQRGATSTGRLTSNRLERCLVVVAVILSVPTTAGATVIDMRALLDRATSVFQTQSVKLVTVRSDRGPGAYYRAGKVYVSPWVYESRFRFEIAAHEFGHHLQGSPAWRRLAGRRSVREAGQYRREAEANVLAVEVLRRVDEISELEAVIRMHRLLAAMATTEMSQSATRPFATEIGASKRLILWSTFRGIVRISCRDVRPSRPCDSSGQDDVDPIGRCPRECRATRPYGDLSNDYARGITGGEPTEHRTHALCRCRSEAARGTLSATGRAIAGDEPDRGRRRCSGRKSAPRFLEQGPRGRMWTANRPLRAKRGRWKR